MKITVKSFLTLRPVMGNQAKFEMEVGETPIREMLDQLCGRFGEGLAAQVIDRDTKEVCHLLRVLVNGGHYKTLADRLHTHLKDGDEVALFPPVAGG
jgi:molybdopterin synthase sulfur carrier subunit